MTDEKKTVLKDGSILERGTIYPPAVEEATFYWSIESEGDAYRKTCRNSLLADRGKEYIDKSRSDEEALARAKSIVGIVIGYDFCGNRTTIPDDAAAILVEEEANFLYAAYLARRNEPTVWEKIKRIRNRTYGKPGFITDVDRERLLTAEQLASIIEYTEKKIDRFYREGDTELRRGGYIAIIRNMALSLLATAEQIDLDVKKYISEAETYVSNAD